MSEAYADILSRTHAWFERVAAAGWLGESERRRFEALERATPADWFADEARRPLVVALFGGTGVGKSSLLNRLAGEEIARTGVERPTSRDVTIYAHEDTPLKALDERFPIDDVRVRRHKSDTYRNVLWIDAPDIDSTEEENRRRALACLPFVDLLCYVVSPERYRDDRGWQVLRERGQRHGWMFVMNHADEADERQRDDFRGMLKPEGFDDPLLLLTCCRPGFAGADEFGQLEAVLVALCEAHAVRELGRLGQRARLQELRHVVQTLANRLGDEKGQQKVREALRERWAAVRAQLQEGGAWGMQVIAARFAVREGSLLTKVGQRLAKVDADKATQHAPGPDPGELAALCGSLWDEWHAGRVELCVDALEVAASRTGLPAPSLRRRLEQSAATARKTVLERVESHVRAALARPGGRWARALRRCTGFLMTALPALALAAVGYLAVSGYYRAAVGTGSFWGSDFALHSALVVAIAWALPFALDRMLRPSLERVVERALSAGYGEGLAALGAQLEADVEDWAAEAREFQQEAQELVKAVAGMLVKPIDPRDPAVARLIANSKRDEAEKTPAASGAGR